MCRTYLYVCMYVCVYVYVYQSLADTLNPLWGVEWLVYVALSHLWQLKPPSNQRSHIARWQPLILSVAKLDRKNIHQLFVKTRWHIFEKVVSEL